MTQIERLDNGAYRLSHTAMLITVSRRVLDDAVPSQLSNASFGWLRGAFPAPDPTGLYLVEFIDRTTVRILAYADRGGGVYRTGDPIEQLPESEPALRMARFNEQKDDGAERGVIEVVQENGKSSVVARYVFRDERFGLEGSWFDFGEHAAGLSYDDALARCYFAFVHRSDLGGMKLESCGISGIDRALNRASFVRALHSVMDEVHRANEAAGVAAPALARYLVRMLDDAHAGDLSEQADELNLARSIRYSDLYYIVPQSNELLHVSGNELSAIESALDVYKLVRDALGDDADTASMKEVARAAMLVRELPIPTVPERKDSEVPAYTSRAEAENAFDLPVYEDALGEWGWRHQLSTTLEVIPSPHRIVTDFRGELASGTVSLVSVVPCADSMPASYWNADSGRWEAYSPEERARMAERYALTCAIACIAATFASSERIMHVNLLEGFASSTAKRGHSEGVFEMDVANDDRQSLTLRSFCRVSVDRSAFCRDGRYKTASADPLAFWMQIGGEVLACAPESDAVDGWPDALDLLQSQMDSGAFADRGDYPEIGDGGLPDAVRTRLGSRYIRDLRIAYSARWRRNAEHLADALAGLDTDVESIRVARKMQEDAGDPFDFDALTRVMGSIVDGTLDTADQNAIVNCYLGEDEFLTTLGQARSILQHDPKRALRLLMDKIDETERSGRFSDSAEVVFRGFDSYPARLLYNLIRSGEFATHSRTFDFGRGDAGKRVELIPDSLFLCYSTAAYAIEQQFDGFDRGVALAKRAIQMAPTVMGGYRQLARAYTLVGDMPSAAQVLIDALHIAVMPNDIATLYYHLGYALWKDGSPLEAALCYLKSVMASPVVAQQASSELRELMHEENIPVLGRPEIDDRMREAGIPLAPTDEVLDAVRMGAEAATDAGLFGVAQSLLTASLHYRPDDALVDVLKSLDGGR